MAPILVFWILSHIYLINYVANLSCTILKDPLSVLKILNSSSWFKYNPLNRVYWSVIHNYDRMQIILIVRTTAKI